MKKLFRVMVVCMIVVLTAGGISASADEPPNQPLCFKSVAEMKEWAENTTEEEVLAYDYIAKYDNISDALLYCQNNGAPVPDFNGAKWQFNTIGIFNPYSGIANPCFYYSLTADGGDNIYVYIWVIAEDEKDLAAKGIKEFRKNCKTYSMGFYEKPQLITLWDGGCSISSRKVSDIIKQAEIGEQEREVFIRTLQTITGHCISQEWAFLYNEFYVEVRYADNIDILSEFTINII